VTDALLEAELYDSLDPQDQQRQPTTYSAPSINSSKRPAQQQQQQQQPPRPSNMNSTDIFMPSSYGTGPSSFLSNLIASDKIM
jgi:hypothetical protein